MIISTTLGELDETLYKYSGLLGWADIVEFQEDERTRLWISTYRIQVPELDLALRSGSILSQHGGEHYEYHDSKTGKHVVVNTPPPADAEWEVDASVSIACELEEKDPCKYLGWSTDGFQGTAYDLARDRYDSFSDLDVIACFIDTADFMEDEEKALRYAKECEEEYAREYGDE